MRSARPAPPLPSATLSWSEVAAYFVLGALLDIAVGLPRLRSVLDGSFLNPDSYMRLVRLREILAQHAPVNVVARDGSGAGTVLHWSHLIDGLILLLALPLRAVMYEAQAVHWAAVSLGPISVGCLGVSLAWIFAPLAGREWRWTAPAAAALSVPIAGYGVPGVVHHHILVALSIVTTVGLAGRVGRGGDRAGALMGASGALGLWLSPETMPFLLAAWGFVGLNWLLCPDRPAHGAALRSGGSSILALIAFAFAIDPPQAGYGAVEIIRLSVVYLTLAVVLAAIGWSAWALDRGHLPPARRAVAGAGVALAGIGLWFALFPAVLKGPNGLMGAAEAKAYYGVIAEMQPIVTAEGLCTFLLDGALATAVVVAVAVRTRSPQWAYGALCSVLILALGASHLRFSTYAAALGAATLPLALAYCGALIRDREMMLTFARTATVGLFVVAPYASVAAARFSPASAAEAASDGCPLRAIAPLLAPYAGETVLADASDTPELLYRTKVLTVGSLYDDIPAFMRLRAAWRSGRSDDLPQVVKATGASLLLFCPRPGRSDLVVDASPDTLLDRLNRGDVPRWLVKLGVDNTSGNELYRIVGGGP